MRIWRIDVACWVTLLGLGSGSMATVLLYKDNIVLTIFLIIISYILWILAFLISNISLIEESVEYLPNWATKLLAWMGVPKAVVQQVKALGEAVVKNNKRRARKITDVLHVVANRSARGLEHSNWRVRKEAVEILSLIAVESFGLVWDLRTRIIYLLVEMLKDPVADVRSLARLSLAKIGPQAMEALKKALREGDPELGEEIDWCLRMMKRMTNDRLKANDWRERLRAVNDLAQMVRPEVIATSATEDEINDLGSALNDNCKEVRLAVVKALISVGNSEVIPFLKQALEDQEGEIQQKAMRGLDDVRQELLVRLRNEDVRVKADAVKGLGLIGNEEDIERLKSRLLDEYTSVRVEAVKALSSIGGEKVIDALIKALHDKAERVRVQAVEALSSMGEPAVEPLREAQKKETDPKVRQVIISALTNLENSRGDTELPLSERLKNYFQLQDSIKNEYREITFADIDVVGSTTLKEGKPKEAVVYSFMQYNQILDNLAQKHRGEVFNHIGDERILVFKNPADAVKMGIELQNTLFEFNKDKTQNRLNQPFKVRIGINTGDVLIDKTVESSEVAEYTLDVACHLQKYGEPDTIYISENTYSNYALEQSEGLELKTSNLFEGPFEFQKNNTKVYIYRL